MSGVIPLSVKGMFSTGHIILEQENKKHEDYNAAQYISLYSLAETQLSCHLLYLNLL